MRSLDPPEEIRLNTDRQEVCRVWIDGGMMSLSLALKLPDDCKDANVVWGMLLSDIYHHVSDAIARETGVPREGVSASLEESFRSVVASERGTRIGTVRTFTDRVPTLPDPDVSGNDDCVEIARIFLLPDSIRVLVYVGMWLPDNEETVWGNILYDLTALVAQSLPSENASELRQELTDSIFRYIENPTCSYSGEYYGNAGRRKESGAD